MSEAKSTKQPEAKKTKQPEAKSTKQLNIKTENLIITPKCRPKFSAPIRLPKKISGKAVIKGTTSAIFYEEFHRESTKPINTDSVSANHKVDTKTDHPQTAAINNTLQHFRQFNCQSTLDHIRNMLTTISEKHLLDSNVQRNEFIFPYHDNYFRFKTTEKTKCYNLEGRPCLIEDCIGYNVVVNLSVTPYDFNKDDKRLIGVSVKADQIKMFVRKE